MLQVRSLLIYTALIFLSLTSGGFAQSDSLSPYAQKIISLAKDVEAKNKLAGKLDPNAMASLPIGILKEIGVTKYIIAIDSGTFKSNGAYFNAYMAMDLPGSDIPLAFVAKSVWFNPKGVGTGSLTRLMLAGKYRIAISKNIALILKPDGTNYVDWDCNGFKSVSLKGYFEFAPGMLIPDSSITHDKSVTASFQLITNDIHNFIADVSVTPFCINGLKDFSFSIKDAAVDMSELANVPGMSFPKGYANTGGITPSVWTGFFMRELKVKLPPELSKGGARIEISASNFLIDKTGVSGNLGVYGLFSLSENDMSGWPFSVDQLSVNFISNCVNGASIAGKLQLPFMNSEASVKYTADMYQNYTSGEIDYSFMIQPTSNVNFSAFAANINIYKTSALSTVKTKGHFVPTVLLNGDMSVSHSSIKLPALKFENLIITAEKPYIKSGIFGLGGIGIPSVGGFSGNIDSVRIILNPLHPELDVTATINFMDQGDFGFSASTTARIIGKIDEVVPAKTSNPETVTPPNKTVWSLDRVAIGAIGLDIKTQPYRIKGGIVYKESDPVFGHGFFGSLAFELNAKPAQFTLAVNAGFGSTPTLRYWYVDGIVSTAIPLGPVAEIKRLMGGMYYHMTPTTGFTSLPGLLYKDTKNVSIPVNYKPDANAGYGFRAGATFSCVKSEKVFNGDVLLTININNTGGLSNITLDGNVVSLSTINDRMNKPIANQKIWGTMRMTYDNTNESFHALMTANINVPNLVRGSGLAEIHFDPKVWRVCIGRPTAPINIKLLEFTSVSAYFMMGHNLDNMTAPPSFVMNIVNGNGLNNSRNLTALQNGNGVAVGVKFYDALDGQFGSRHINVSYRLWATVGFDIMAADYGTNAKCGYDNSPLGINGWYCQGQAYFGVEGNLSAHADLDLGIWEPSLDVDIANFSAAALLQVQAPKPVYISGSAGIKFHAFGMDVGPYDVSFTYGDACGTILN